MKASLVRSKRSYDELVKDVKRWKPSHNYRKEQGYTDELRDWLEGRGHQETSHGGATLPDLLVDNRYPIEMKRIFNSKSQ